MTDDRPTRALDDLLGQKVHVRGQEWTVRYSEVARQVVLERPIDMDPVLQAMREGKATLQTDPEDLLKANPPDSRAGAVREWLLLDAIIAGGRTHGLLSEEAIAVLERRLALVTAVLEASTGDR